MNNRWNQFIYARWAPIYDRVLDATLFVKGRRRALALLAPQPGQRLLLVGVGTGADLPWLPAGVSAIGVDLSAAMLARAKAKAASRNPIATLIRSDAGRLPVAMGTCDGAVLNLVLSVVPDPRACWAETTRVVRPGSRIVVFDKFVADDADAPLGRRLLNLGARCLGTDINRRLVDIVDDDRNRVLADEASVLGGLYRIVLFER